MKTPYLVTCLTLASVLIVTPLSADTTSADATPTSVENASASDGSTATSPSIPKSVFKAIAQKAYLPLYKAADQTASELQRAVIGFCNQPDIRHLQQTRQHWSNAVEAWEASEVALFGPAITKHRDWRIYLNPIKKRVIKKLLTQTTPITIENLEFAGVGAMGFGTLEYLLFDREATDDEILKRFVGDDNRYCEHLLAASTLLQQDTAVIYSEWSNHYADAISTAGSSEQSVFVNDQQALEIIVGKADQLAEMATNKLRHALAKNAQLAGKDDARENTNAYRLEAWRSGHTLANVMANIQGIEQVLTQGGLFDWLNQSGETEIVKQLEASFNTIKALRFPSTDLFAQIEAKDLKAADALFDEIMALSMLIHQAAPKLGVQLGFNDSDGD